MQERRRDLLEPLIKEINHKAYEVIIIELGVELSDVYGAMFDVCYEDLNQKGIKPKKSESASINANGLKSIEHSKQVIEIILKREEKYDYT